MHDLGSTQAYLEALIWPATVVALLAFAEVRALWRFRGFRRRRMVKAR